MNMAVACNDDCGLRNGAWAACSDEGSRSAPSTAEASWLSLGAAADSQPSPEQLTSAPHCFL
jgi:hypothetical protein